tara:strand:- start:7907 stop:12925 length:5019 start_codon:yes stop_codon:yes gene_type:complete
MPRFAPIIYKAGKALPKAWSYALKDLKRSLPTYFALPPAKDTSTPNAKTIASSASSKAFLQKYASYIGEGRQTRIVLQSDKPMYKPGETIWVRAAEIKLRRNRLASYKDLVRFTLKDPRGAVAKRRLVQADHGHGHTAFTLSKHAKGGEYTLHVHFEVSKQTAKHKIFVHSYQPPRIKKKLEFIREAYGAGDTVEATLSLRAATGQPLRSQAIQLYARLDGKVIRTWGGKTDKKGKALLSFKLPDALKTRDGSLTVRVGYNGITETISRPIPLVEKKYNVGFFPEGGHTLLGHPSRVYFAVRRLSNNKPMDIEGVLQSDKGKILANVRSFHDGMGRFVYTPKADEKVSLKITKPLGSEGTYPLPAAKKEGIQLRVLDDFRAKRNALHVLLTATKPQHALVTAIQYEEIVGSKSISLRKGVQKLVLPLAHQWRGIVRLTVSTTSGAPLAERLIFRHAGKGLRFKIETSQATYQPRQTVRLKVKALTPAGKPLKGVRLGMSVVDDTVLSFADSHEPRFLAQRYLTTQLVGEIHKPNFYFDPKKPKAPRALDLVMGTHGWRGFTWKQLEESTKKTILASNKQRTSQIKQVAQRSKRIYRRSWRRWPDRVLTDAQRKQKYRMYRRTRGYGLLGVLRGGGSGSSLGSRGFGRGGGGAKGGLGTRLYRRRVYGRGGMNLRGHSKSVKRFRGRRTASRSNRRRYRSKRRRRLRKRKPRRRRAIRVVSPQSLSAPTKRLERATRVAQKQPLAARHTEEKAKVRTKSIVRKESPKPTRRAPKADDKEAVGDVLRAQVKPRGLLGAKGGGVGGLSLSGGAYIGYGKGYGHYYRRYTRPSVRLGKIRVQGPNRRRATRFVTMVLRRKRRQFSYIYKRGLRRNPSLRGRIKVRLLINQRGRVARANIQQNQLDNYVARGILRRLQRLRFPRPKSGSLMVTVPIDFRTRQTSRRWRRRHRTRSTSSGPWSQLDYVRVFPTHFYKKEAQGGKQVRKDFRETLYWNPMLVTDEWGEVKISFGLNDKVTSFRVRIAGIGQEALGVAEKVIRSTRPYFMAAKLPVEVSTDDAMVLPLTLRNDTKKALSLTIKTSFDKKVFRLMEDPLPEAISLPAGEARTYFYPFRVTAKRGKGFVQFSSESEGFSDQVERTISIRPRGYPAMIAEAGQLPAGKTHRWHFMLPNDLKGAAPKARIDLYVNPLASFQRAIGSMIRSPHGCFEQTSSSNYPNILVMRYLRARGVKRPALMKRTYQYLKRGYQRLIGYEVPGGGFDWYGSPPAHEPLTAYGIMQFVEMKKVFPGVSQAMIDRNVRWLHAKRDGKGGYLRSTKRRSFGSVSKQLVDAYITHALAEAGQKDVNQEIRGLEDAALGTKDPYFMSLVANAILKVRGSRDRVAKQLLRSLERKQRSDGHFHGRKTSITNSYGRNLHVETTALATRALIRGGRSRTRIKRALRWLRRQRRPYGGFGSTQATILALQAMVEFEETHKRAPEGGKVVLWVNGKRVKARVFSANGRNRLSFRKIERHLQPGKNEIAMKLTSHTSVPFSFGVEYTTFQPDNHEKAAVSIDTALDKSQLKLGEVVRLTAKVTNRTKESVPSTLVRIAYPGALRIQPWQLKALKKTKKVAFYELKPREIILYLRGLQPGERKTFHLDLVARVTGNYNSSSSVAYLYYTDTRKFWAPPLRVSVTP